MKLPLNTEVGEFSQSDLGIHASPIRQLDPVLDSLYSLFGDNTVFVPVKDGKIAAKGDIKTLSVAQTQTAAYQNALWDHDIAVVCDRASGQLCAVRFPPDKAALEAFLAVNPGLRTVLRTTNPDGIFLWLRINGYCPTTTAAADGVAWMADGQVIKVHERNSLEPKHGCIVSKPPGTFEFKELDWSWNSELNLAFTLQRMTRQHGAMTRTDAKGRVMLNLNFMAAMLAEQMGLVFDCASRQFLQRATDGASGWSFIPAEFIMRQAAAHLRLLLNDCGDALAVDPCSEPELRKMVNAMKVVAAAHLPGQMDAFRNFVRERLEKDKASNMTTKEVFTAYCRERDQAGLVRLPERVFEQRLPKVMSELFSVSKTHGLIRDGEYRRGFIGVRLKIASASTALRDAQDGQDATPAPSQQEKRDTGLPAGSKHGKLQAMKNPK